MLTVYRMTWVTWGSSAGTYALPTALQRAKAVAIAPGVAAIILPALISYGTDFVPFFWVDT